MTKTFADFDHSFHPETNCFNSPSENRTKNLKDDSLNYILDRTELIQYCIDANVLPNIRSTFSMVMNFSASETCDREFKIKNFLLCRHQRLSFAKIFDFLPSRFFSIKNIEYWKLILYYYEFTNNEKVQISGSESFTRWLAPGSELGASWSEGSELE